MNRGANYSCDPDLINLITLTEPNVCERAIQQPQKTKHDGDGDHRAARQEEIDSERKSERNGRKNCEPEKKTQKQGRREKRKDC